jgi:hypothetical protein
MQRLEISGAVWPLEWPLGVKGLMAQTGVLSVSISFLETGCQIRGVRWVGDDSHFLFRQKLLGENGGVRRGFVMVKQPGLLSPKFGATSSHVFTQSPQNVAVEPGIHSLACWDRCFNLPQLLYRWRNQSGIFWIPPRTSKSRNSTTQPNTS